MPAIVITHIRELEPRHFDGSAARDQIIGVFSPPPVISVDDDAKFAKQLDENPPNVKMFYEEPSIREMLERARSFGLDTYVILAETPEAAKAAGLAAVAGTESKYIFWMTSRDGPASAVPSCL